MYFCALTRTLKHRCSRPLLLTFHLILHACRVTRHKLRYSLGSWSWYGQCTSMPWSERFYPLSGDVLTTWGTLSYFDGYQLPDISPFLTPILHPMTHFYSSVHTQCFASNFTYTLRKNGSFFVLWGAPFYRKGSEKNLIMVLWKTSNSK